VAPLLMPARVTHCGGSGQLFVGESFLSSFFRLWRCGIMGALSCMFRCERLCGAAISMCGGGRALRSRACLWMRGRRPSLSWRALPVARASRLGFLPLFFEFCAACSAYGTSSRRCRRCPRYAFPLLFLQPHPCALYTSGRCPLLAGWTPDE
jgi:hypothetical protein